MNHEYINVGQSVKIPLMKESTLLGRLASQVDFAVNMTGHRILILS